MIRRIIQRRMPIEGDAGLPKELHPVLRRVYAQRGISDPQQLDLSLSQLLPPDALSGINRAVGLLIQALRKDQRILVIGDFDADGATSTVLAVRALRAMGAREVRYLVPNRFRYGYGLTPEIVDVAAALDPQLIITVDNGVGSVEGVAAARQYGIHVLITDHHLQGKDLPDANAIVNPNLEGDPFPSKSLAGVGVVLYVMAALRNRLRDDAWFEHKDIAEPKLAQFLDLVALGTVADLVPLDHNNRILVEQGLRRIRAGHGLPGISALLELAGRTPQRALTSDLGFAVGPRLNAAGRLKDMALGIECLLADSKERARQHATELNRLNQQRREIEAQMQTQALALVTKVAGDVGEADNTHGYCLYESDWHQGVIGIVASRIKERFHRPVIAFADAGEADLKGSARSIPGLHIRDLLETIAARDPDLITRFGGHAMAAGLSLPKANLSRFGEAFDWAVKSSISQDQLEGHLLSDGELVESEMTLEVAEQIAQAGPWGQNFPEPVFDGLFRIVQYRGVSGKHIKMVVRPVSSQRVIDAIVFNAEACGWREGLSRIHMAYTLEINDYQGLRNPQLVVRYLQAADSSAGNCAIVS